MAEILKLDEATLAKVKAYAAEAFDGFDADKTPILEIKHKTVEVPYLRPPTLLDDEWLPRYKDFTFNIPTNWFEQFKDDYWPRWLRRLWPVRTGQVVRSYPVFSPAFASLNITTEPHTLPDGEVIEMGYSTCGDGQLSALAVRVVE